MYSSFDFKVDINLLCGYHDFCAMDESGFCCVKLDSHSLHNCLGRQTYSKARFIFSLKY